MLNSTLPDTAGKAAVIMRVKQLTDFKWTPLRDVPTYTKEAGKTVDPAGVEVTGMPYSSAMPNDKFICENVTYHTLLSAMANPDSALYQKDLGGHRNSWTYFGIVCNGLVRYALNIIRRYATKHWLDIPGMRLVEKAGEYTAEQIRLCDVLWAYVTGRTHVAIITGILRDESGVIREIEVSEAVRPTCIRARYGVEEYFEKYKQFSLCRYDGIDRVPAPDPEDDAALKRGVSKTLPAVAVDYGDKANYLSGEEVVISVFAPGEHTVEIVRDGEVIERVSLAGGAKITRKPDCGHYAVRLADTGDSTQFRVNDPGVTFTVKDGKVTFTVRPSDPDSRILHMEFCSAPVKAALDPEGLPYGYAAPNYAAWIGTVEPSEEEIASGVFTREIPEGAKTYKFYFRNPYGVWSHSIESLNV